MNRPMKPDRELERGKVLVPILLSLAIVAGLVLFKVSGLFAQIGWVATSLLIAGDLLVLVLVWIRACR